MIFSMNQKTFSLVAGIIFLLIAILHLARSIWGWEAVIAAWQVPMWASWAAVVVAGFLAYQGLRKR